MKNNRARRFIAFIFIGLSWCTVALAQSDFVVSHIKIQGVQRISYKTVRSYLPIAVGQHVDSKKLDVAIRALYSTGFFSDVKLLRQGNVLVVRLKERYTIGEVYINGNRKVSKKTLQKALEKVGVVRGQELNEFNLTKLKNTILEEYQKVGEYQTHVVITQSHASRHRVNLNIRVVEQGVTRITSIRIIGNHAFSQFHLLQQISLTSTKPWSLLIHNDRYTPERLKADLFRLQLFYLDEGYINFHVVDSHVTFDRYGHARIVITVHEGPRYQVSAVKVTGKLLGYGQTLRALIPIKPGDYFSRRQIIATERLMLNFLADKGYAFVNVQFVPEVDQLHHTVVLHFSIMPGRHVYVRHIRFFGNLITSDEVLRREMQLMEGSPFSLSAVKESNRRLANLGYIEDIHIKKTKVPGYPSQVDLDVNVKDSSAPRANVKFGYSGAYGYLVGGSFTDKNFLGTGRFTSLNFNHSEYATSYAFSYSNPYYTPIGISRGFSVYSQHITPGKVNLTDYTMDTFGTNLMYGFPISEFSRFDLSFGYEHIKITNLDRAPSQITSFLTQQGKVFNQVHTNLSWTYSHYDRAILPTQGFTHVFSTEIGLPLLKHDLEYYQFEYQAGYYYPLIKNFIFHAHGNIAYGHGYGDTGGFPFFKNYYAGGIGTVRGYTPNTLGPKNICGPGSGSRCDARDTIGGNSLVAGSLELIFPNPLGERFRTSVFVDAGNVYNNRMRFNQLRYGAGLAINFVVPVLGEVRFSFAKAFHDQPGDDKRTFDFAFGSSL